MQKLKSELLARLYRAFLFARTLGPRYTRRMDRSEAGRKGNQAAREKDPEHQAKAGKQGIRSLAAKYFDGSIGEAMAYLRSRQTTYQLDQAADEQNARMLANGREIACTELPVCTEPEDDPTYWREMVSSQSQSRSRAG